MKEENPHLTRGVEARIKASESDLKSRRVRKGSVADLMKELDPQFPITDNK